MEKIYHVLVIHKWKVQRRGYPETIRGMVRILESPDDPEMVGKDVYIKSVKQLPLFVRRNVLLRIIGSTEPLKGNNVLCLASGKKSLTVDFSAGSIRSLLCAGISIQQGAELDQTLTENGSVFVSDAISSDIDPGQPEAIEGDETGFPPGISAIDNIDYIKNCTDLAAIQEIFINADLPYDYDRIALINETLRYRAARMKKMVIDLILMAPWVIVQVEGFSMKEADQLAKYLQLVEYPGFKLDDDARIYAEITSIVWNAARNDGDMYIPCDRLCAKVMNGTAKGSGRTAEDVMGLCRKFWKEKDEERAREINPYGSAMGGVNLCSKRVKEAVIADRLRLYEEMGLKKPKNSAFKSDDAYRRHRAEKDASAAYTPRAYFSEIGAAKALAAMVKNNFEPLPIIPPARFEGKKMDPEQKNMMSTFMKNRVTVATGHAGTGKTLALRSLASLLRDAGMEPIMLAPTGVAADRAASGLNIPSGTIHRFAGSTEKDDDLMVTERKSDDELSMLYGRTVLVDEMSMCDIVVFCYLLNAVGPDGHLLLVLDPDQLPSIGPSGFMQQILRLNPYGIAICELGKVHRRKVAPGKFDLAESIRNGKFPVEEILKDATITLDPDISAEHIVNKVRELKDSGVSIGDIMVLCPGRSGVNGADTLTGQLQKLWNPDGAKIADTNYRVGDIVINVRNDYADLKKRRRAWDKLRHPDRKDNIFNGYRGIIAPGANKGTVTVQYTTPSCPVSVPYTAEELRYWVEPAYALTVHKAQGGEAKHVIFVLPGIKYRAMLYTAATRRKETICLMGSVEHFTKSAEEKETPPLTKFVQRYLEILDIDMGEEPSDIWIKI